VSHSPALPLVREIQIPSPLAALHALAEMKYPFLLHTSAPDRRSRWSFFGAVPFHVARDGDWDAARRGARAFAREAGFGGSDEARALAPFTGGVVGYWSYDFARRFERLPEIARDDFRRPDFVLGFYDVIGTFDHETGTCRLFSSGLPERGPARLRRAASRLDAFTGRILGLWDEFESSRPREALEGSEPCAVSTMTPRRYRENVEAIREFIRAGDIYQANLSQRWTLRLPERMPLTRGYELYRALARLSPSPFSAYLQCGDHAVVSASPERFLELRGRTVETRPIKGTRPRGGNPVADARLAAELLASEKDRAENVMIVDVLRNDLGRVCDPGSVETTGMCELESFRDVHHLTSTVTGRLRLDLDAFDLLKACFPGGSITGAPKLRAMEILESLEPVRRHIYTGAIGYVDWRGDADWNIAIRTALVTGHGIHFAAGGGITIDSDPDAEYEESLAKVKGMRRALEACYGPIALEGLPAGVR
jgi:para-aminobenzoate synthetase component 1